MFGILSTEMEAYMKLKGKILALSLIPVVTLGIVMLLAAADRIANGIYDEAYIGMQATALAVRDIFEVGNSGSYHLDENGMMWKGDTLNISQAENITDHIKENTGMEVTIFWGDTRILTSIVNERGERQINTQASAEVARRVLKNGETYQDRNVEILGKNYIVCYTPVYQENSSEIIGMVFLGTPQETVSAIINKVRKQFFLIIICMVIFVAAVAYILVSRIIMVLEKNMSILDSISKGILNIDIEQDILNRKDEIGDLGKNILHLKNSLRDIVKNIHAKSNELSSEATHIETISLNVYQVMKEVNNTTQEMAESSTAQAQDANQASANVSAMGTLIENNTIQLNELHSISGDMKSASAAVAAQFEQLNTVMQSVKESIHFLSQQTSLTNESVAKISSAAELITAIASQTNLLSLNASIEAARAGEHGRGFSVVASEIQQLSEQSNSAAGRIQVMITNLNANSAQTLERVKQVQGIIEKQEMDIQATGEIFQKVRRDIDKSVADMDMIMENSKKLEDTRTDTVAIVQNSAALSQENSASLEEVMASIENIYHELGNISEKTGFLKALSQKMTESVDVFHT